VEINVKKEMPHTVTTKSEALNMSGGFKINTENKTTDETTNITAAITRTVLSRPFEMLSFIKSPPGKIIIRLI
jgi:hypothetical protein